MAKKDTRGGNNARLVSPYINTTGKCLELFYFIRGKPWPKERAFLKVFAITEEHSESLLHESSYLATDFQRLYLRLPDGTHRIAIEGKRPDKGFSTASLDDVTVMNCDSFGKLNERNVLMKVKT